MRQSNSCSSECAGRVSISIGSAWRRIAERFRWVYQMRSLALLLLALGSAGCASVPKDDLMHVVSSRFESKWLDRAMLYFVAWNSSSETNHFYVGATAVDGRQLLEALVYWKEGRRVMVYREQDENAAEGLIGFAWPPQPSWHLLRDTRDSMDEGLGQTCITVRMWTDWMEECLHKGRMYSVARAQATNAFPDAVVETNGEYRK